jgi:hypothetical protein
VSPKGIFLERAIRAAPHPVPGHSAAVEQQLYTLAALGCHDLHTKVDIIIQPKEYGCSICLLSIPPVCNCMAYEQRLAEGREGG